MYSLTIHFGPNAMAWSFLFKDKEKAEDAELHATAFLAEAGHFKIIDDYGQIASFCRDSVHGVLLEDMDAGEEARIQRGLSQARGQAKANERAKTDPVLRQAMGGRGPGVISPFGNGQFQ